MINIILVGCFFLSGCASLVNTNEQMIGFSSNPAGAKVVVQYLEKDKAIFSKNKYGNIVYGLKEKELTCMTPCSLNLSRGNKIHNIIFQKENYNDSSATLTHSVSGYIWGNILLGGIIGLAIDFGSGSAYKIKPENVHADLIKK